MQQNEKPQQQQVEGVDKNEYTFAQKYVFFK